MTQPTALFLADILEDAGKPADIAEKCAAELRRLHAENFALAAGQCLNAVGDEGGTPICAKAAQLQMARERDNASFKQLLAQSDALLEALKQIEPILARMYGTQAAELPPMQIVRAAIAKAEGV